MSLDKIFTRGLDINAAARYYQETCEQVETSGLPFEIKLMQPRRFLSTAWRYHVSLPSHLNQTIYLAPALFTPSHGENNM